MKVEDVALHIYCMLMARESPASSISEDQRQEKARRAFTYAAEFLSVCQEQAEGKR